MSVLGSLIRVTGSVVVGVSSYLLFDYFQRRRKFDSKVRRVREILEGKLGRPLECYDAFFEHSQLRGQYLLSVAFFFEGVAPLEERALTRALWMVAAANPMLRLRIDSLDGEKDVNGFPKPDDLLYFVEMEEFHPDFEVLDTDDWLGVLEKDISQPMDSTAGPLWRVKMLQGSVTKDKHRSVLVCTFHLGIIDGKSLMVFGDQLVKELIHHRVWNSQSSIAQMLPPSYKEIMGEDLLEFSLLVKAILYLGGKWMDTFNVTPRAPACSFINFTTRPETLSTPNESRLRMIPFQLSAKGLEQLLRRCHRYNCSLPATLQAVVSFAQVETLNAMKDEGVELPDPMEISNYFRDSREFWDPSDEETIGFDAQSPWIWFKAQVGGDLDFWTLAKTFNEEVQKMLRPESFGDLFLFNTLFDFFYRIFPDWFMRMSRPNILTVDNALSDLGVFFEGRAERRPLDIVGAYATLNMTRSDYCFVHCVFSIRGRLFWTISFDESIFSAEVGRVFAEKVEATLRKVVEGRIH